MPRNTASRATRRLDQAVELLNARMPPGWLAKTAARLPEGGVVRLLSSGSDAGDLVVWTKAELPPSAVTTLNPPTSPTVIFARWISPRTQELLRARGIGFLDTTGNVEVLLDSPAFYISAQGATRDPQPKPAQRPSLRGPRVWALLRTIIEVERRTGCGNSRPPSGSPPATYRAS